MNKFRSQAEAKYLSHLPETDHHQFTREQLIERIRELEIQRIEMELNRDDVLRKQTSEHEQRVRSDRQFNEAPVPLFILSRDGKIKETNKLGALMLQRNTSSAQHSSLAELISKDSQPFYSHFLFSVFQISGSASCEVMLHSDGHILSSVMLCGSVTEANSECSVAVFDISGQKMRSVLLEKSINSFRNMFNQHYAVMLLIDPGTGAIIDANVSAARFYGYSINDLQKLNMSAIESAAEAIGSDGGLHARVHQQNEFVFQHRIAGGESRTVEVHSSPVEFDGRQLLFSIINDITDRQQSEYLLRKSEEKYRGLVYFSNDPIFSFNPDETYRFVNEAFARPFGKKPDEIIGHKPHSVFSFEEAEKRLTIVRGVFQSGVKRDIEVKVLTQSGDTRYFLTMVDPIKDEEGKVQYVSCIAKDITERKQVEIEREHLITELQNALEQIKTLKGIVPICSSCKNVRDDEGFWEQVESYVQKHTDAQFSHSLCPNCVEKYFPNYSKGL
jgi:PAS domain S-box-containing protein